MRLGKGLTNVKLNVERLGCLLLVTLLVLVATVLLLLGVK